MGLPSEKPITRKDPMSTEPDPIAGPAPAAAGARIVAVARELAEAFQGLVDAIPGRPRRPQALGRVLKIDKSVAHRLITAIRKDDPLATAHVIPGPEPLRRIARTARQQRVPEAVTGRVEKAILAFESLIADEGGDRAGLDAIISTWLPSARERFERLAKQALYRGARQLKGLAAEVHFGTHLIHPSADPGWCDAASVFGYLGLHRIRPEATLKLGILRGTSNRAGRTLTLTKKPVEDPHEILWHRFCSQPEVELIVHRVPESEDRVYELEWRDAVGPNSARNIVMCDFVEGALRRYCRRDDPRPKTGISEFIVVPARKLVFDVLVDADVYPGWQPQIRTVETGARGMSDPNDPTRESDVLPILERVELIGRGIERFWAEEIPDYIEMLREVCGTLGWDAQRFRGYRARIDYPVFNSEVEVGIDLPVAPSPPPTPETRDSS
jgi:hypothetical protein